MFTVGILLLFGAALVTAPLLTLAVVFIWWPVEREAARVRQEAQEALEAEGGSQ